MAEKLAELRQKGGGGMGTVLFEKTILNTLTTSWANVAFTTLGLCEKNFLHINNNGSLAVDTAVSNVHIVGQSYRWRNSSGTTKYSGVQVLKNGTLIPGASIMGSSSSNFPTFDVAIDLAVGDVLTVQVKGSEAITSSVAVGYVGIKTD